MIFNWNEKLTPLEQTKWSWVWANSRRLEAWRVPVHGVAMSCTQLNDWATATAVFGRTSLCTLIGATFIKAKKFPSFVPFVSAVAVDMLGRFCPLKPKCFERQVVFCFGRRQLPWCSADCCTFPSHSSLLQHTIHISLFLTRYLHADHTQLLHQVRSSFRVHFFSLFALYLLSWK